MTLDAIDQYPSLRKTRSSREKCCACDGAVIYGREDGGVQRRGLPTYQIFPGTRATARSGPPRAYDADQKSPTQSLYLAAAVLFQLLKE